MKTILCCDACGAGAPWLVQSGDKWVGPCCVPGEAWDAYPGWKAREDLRTRRAELARVNFRKEAA